MTKKLSNVQAATDHDITGAPRHAQRPATHTAPHHAQRRPPHSARHTQRPPHSGAPHSGAPRSSPPHSAPHTAPSAVVCALCGCSTLQHPCNTPATPLQHPCNTPAAADDLGGQVQAARDARAAKAPDHLTLTPEHPNT